MKKETKTFIFKGKEYPASFMLPESISEAKKTMSDEDIYECFIIGYRVKQRDLAIGKKKRTKRWLKLDLSVLSEDTINLLKKSELL